MVWINLSEYAVVTTTLLALGHQIDKHVYFICRGVQRKSKGGTRLKGGIMEKNSLFGKSGTKDGRTSVLYDYVYT